jgi:ribonucleoside-diphosphate reductase alpha chain
MENNKYWWLNEESHDMLKRGYLVENQSVEEKLDLICSHASNILKRPDLKERFLNVFEKGWASLSSPIWANFGQGRALPISCFSSFCPDSLEGIYSTLKEVALMTKHGGGTAGYFPLRPTGSGVKGGATSSGAMSFIKLFDSTIEVVKQNNVRRGAFAGYMDIDHPEIASFLEIKDKGHEMQTMNTAVNVTNEWMESMIAGDQEKRETWAAVLRSRREKGIPYIHFIDNVNNNAPQVYKDKGLKINQSNLCNEIELSTSEDESLVCCLLSMNLYTYDEWKNTDAVELMVYFLDAVMEDFITKAKTLKGLERAVKFAESQRALGLGVLGYFSYLQKHHIPFESLEASLENHAIFKNLQEKAIKASQKLALEYGEPELLKGYGLRNTTLIALAPTTSSSSILGQVSPSIEPYKSNYFTVGLAKGSFTRKNKELEKLLESIGQNTKDIWESILKNKGSVQHLTFLSERDKQVFKTFEEISPLVIIQQAADRQKFICQSQSLNLMIPNSVEIKQINAWMIEAWKLGIKGLYYQRGTSIAKEQVLKMLECNSCEA